MISFKTNEIFCYKGDNLPFIGGVLKDWEVIMPLSTNLLESIDPVGVVTVPSSDSFFTTSVPPKAFFTPSSCFKSVKIIEKLRHEICEINKVNHSALRSCQI